MTQEKDKNNPATPKLEHIVIIGKFNDGQCRQIVIDLPTQDVVLSAIIAREKSIRVLETVIEGVDIEFPQPPNTP